jgi:hypothetical protein
MKVYKYSKPLLEVEDYVEFDIPGYVETLSVGEQRDNLCVWVLVSGLSKVTHKVYRLVGTGQSIDELYTKFVGTVQYYSGSLIVHVFE